MSGFVALAQGDGLTLREILADIPHDGPAVLVYAIFVLFIGFIWWGSRDRSGRGGTTTPPGAKPSSPRSQERHD